MQYDLSVDDVRKVIQANNNDIGGRIILENGYEHIITARGYLKSVVDIENITITNQNNTPLKIKDIAEVNITPASYRDWEMKEKCPIV